jgi:hypothetical protein
VRDFASESEKGETKVRNRIAVLFLLVLGFCGYAEAQVPTPAINTFSTTLSAVNLPGSNGGTMAGTLAGFNYQVTPDFALKQTNLISSGATTNGFFGGGDYTLPSLSKKLNNASASTNGYDFQFQLTGSVGALRATQPSGAMTQSWAALFGGRVNYAMKGSKTFSIAVEVQDLYAASGLPHKNNLLVALGPAIHF